MPRYHHYKTTVKWTGNKGTGPDGYRNYSRNHRISIDYKADILGSSDPAFLGDNTRHNPEELLVASLSTCHMLWYLHLCSDAGVVVLDYTDHATGTMEETSNGGGKFTEVVLNPIVMVQEASMLDRAKALHQKAQERCFISNSVNFPVKHNPVAELG